MVYDRIVATLSLLVDIGILIILVLEFNYDKIRDEKEAYHRRIRRKKLNFERLTIGEILKQLGK